MRFLEILDKLLKEKKQSGSRMSLNLGLSKDAYYVWKRRGNLPSGGILEKLADYFDVSVDYLLGRTEYRKTAGGELPEEAVKELEDFLMRLGEKYKGKG